MPDISSGNARMAGSTPQAFCVGALCAFKIHQCLEKRRSEMAVALEPVTPRPAGANAGQRVSPAALTKTVQRLMQEGARRVVVSTTRAEPLLEISLVAPTLHIVLRVLDAVDVIAASAHGDLIVDTLPALRRTYRGSRNWVARARLRTTPSRLEH
jgi:hypothetical protein